MSTNDLAALDVDGALRDSIEAVAPTRAGFLGRAALAAGGLLSGGAVLAALPGKVEAFNSTNTSILNFALTLEYLETAFYASALLHAGLKGPDLTFAKVVHAHEATHVAALKKVLGSAAVKEPKFDFGAATQTRSAFLNTSVSLEDTGVAAYKGQAPRLQSDTLLAVALSIHSVEAKHSAWVRGLLNGAPSPAAFEGPKTMAEVLAIVKSTGFIVG